MLANNLANASAPGFKVDREHYSTYLSGEAAESPAGDFGSVMPVIERQWTDFSQGTIIPTGNPLDIALRGKGFFVATSSGRPLLTRDGSFRLSPQGELQTQEGFNVRGHDGKPIQVDSSKPVEITPEGEVRQDGQVIARLDVVDIKEPDALDKHGLNYYQCSPILMTPVPSVQMQQGSLEAANMQPAETAVRLISVMRQFEMLQRAAALGSDMSRRTLEEVAKATG